MIEFLKVAIDSNNFEQVLILHSEICFVQYAARRSPRTSPADTARAAAPCWPRPASGCPSHVRSRPFAPRRFALTARPTDRYKKTLYDTLAMLCGDQFVEPLPETSYHKPSYAVPSETAHLDPAPSMASLFNTMLLTYPTSISV